MDNLNHITRHATRWAGWMTPVRFFNDAGRESRSILPPEFQEWGVRGEVAAAGDRLAGRASKLRSPRDRKGLSKRHIAWRLRRLGRKAVPVTAALLAASLLIGFEGAPQGDQALGGATDERAGATWHAAKAMQAKGRQSSLADTYRTAGGIEITASHLREYLQSYGSPMAEHAETIIVAANLHKVDPRLVVAIAGVESSYGKHAYGYNAWGWNNGYTRWGSWEESILDYTSKMAELYPDRNNIRQMAWRYNPVTPQAWGAKVSYIVSTMGADA